MNTVRFVKSFSKGQITIPKDLRDALGIVNEFWLKLYIQNGKIIAEPVEQEKNKADYAKKLLNIKGDWFNSDEARRNREQVEKQMDERAL